MLNRRFNEDLDSMDNVISFFLTGPKLSCLKKRVNIGANSLRGIFVRYVNDDEFLVAFAFFIRHEKRDRQ